MGIDFKLRDFAYPMAIWRKKRRFDREQWLPPEQLSARQWSRLQGMLRYAHRYVPYYTRLFQQLGLGPDDLRSFDDLGAIPYLTKDLVRTSFDALRARHAWRYHPRLLMTSGTTGGQVRFLVDKPSNVLEFVYYWRLWGWAGFRLGDTFAELSAQAFTPYARHSELYRFEHATRRLLLNSLSLQRSRAPDYLRVLRQFAPRFLKGLPTNLHLLASLLGEQPAHGLWLEAVFVQGETLQATQRRAIEQAFGCSVFDAYGHLERTVAVSQCPLGSYHVHTDYGVLELVDPPPSVVLPPLPAGQRMKEIVGTSLHNRSMPLIRYRTGDYAVVRDRPERCECGRGFPTLVGIWGRESDVVVTPDGRAVTALYVALHRTPGILLGQIVQETVDSLLIKVSYAPNATPASRGLLEKNLRDFVGESIRIRVEEATLEEMWANPRVKFKSVVSQLGGAVPPYLSLAEPAPRRSQPA